METNSSDEEIIRERKRKLASFFGKGKDWIFYCLLAVVVWISVYIRTRNIPYLKDITTGGWALGPDLDPYLFLRWAKDIVANGTLMTIDTMRNVPLGYDTSGEMKLLAYMIAWFHNALSALSLSNDVTYSAIIFPVFMTALTAIAFFFLARKIFSNEDRLTANIIAIISALLFVLTPSLLPRTIAGIPEKESAAFFFMFISFYFFISAYSEEKKWKIYLYSGLSGLSTALMALLWGGSGLAFMTLAAAVMFAFLLGKIDLTKFYALGIWLVVTFGVMMPFSSRYNIMNLVSSTSTGSVVAVFFVIFVHYFFTKNLEKKDSFKKYTSKYPSQLFSSVVAILFVILLSMVLFGTGFFIGEVKAAISQSVHPLDVSRFGLTVAENKQPYFMNDWKDNFGPSVRNIPLFFWLFFIGSIALFASMIKSLNKKEKYLLVFAYTAFLFGLIFSKYSPNSVLNGNSTVSLFIYFGGMLFFVGCFMYVYLKRYKSDKFDVFREFNFAYILYFVILTLGIVAARGGIRLILILATINPVVVGFLNAKVIKEYFNQKEDIKKFLVGIAAIIIILSTFFTAYVYYQSDKSIASGYAPASGYSQQWQNAMAWVRGNTSTDSVFAHWWDYGYWLQSIGERATVLDGGNAITYWNHLMGRYVLTGKDDRKSIEFLYAHKTTHLLIDSTEIGKYSAFSSIGSDENYDRFSWINTFVIDESRSVESRDSKTNLYTGGSSVDEDIVWNSNGTDIFLPRGSSTVVGVLLTLNNGKVSSAEGIYFYKNAQYNIPLRYVYYNDELIDLKEGLDAGIFVYPLVSFDSNGQGRIINDGAMLYLSKRTVHSGIARLYLFGENSPYFKLVHSEDEPTVANLKSQGLTDSEFMQINDFKGPIKIWEVNYPSGITVNPDYLKTDYPNQEIKIAKSGYY